MRKKKTNLIKELLTQSDKNITEEKGKEIRYLHLVIQTLKRQNFDGFGSDHTNSIWNELTRLSSTYPIQ